MRRRTWLGHCSAWLWLAGAARSALAAAAPGPLLVLGDSLSAGYGLARSSGWVALLEQRLARDGKAGPRVVNASISGDTTAGGRTRLPGLLARDKPSILILELGANDALRGLPLAATRANLIAMTRTAKGAGAQVVIVGMQLPPNYGKNYGDEFAALFGEVAKAEGAALVPFLLAGVADAPQAESLFQADGLHPTAAAQPTLLDNVWRVLAPLLK